MNYLFRRFIRALFLLVGVSILTFLFADLAPGSFFDDMKLNPQISEQTFNGLKAQYGLNQPMSVRYVLWTKSVVKGDWGFSFAYNSPVRGLLYARAWNTLLLAVTSAIIAWILAISLGLWASNRPNGWVDRLCVAGTSLMVSIPELVVLFGLLYMVVRSNALPVGGMASIQASQLGLWPRFLDLGAHMLIPVSALVFASLPLLLRHVRASMIEVLNMPFIQAAHGHGIPRGTLLFRYALPAASNPLISLLGFSIGGLLSASLLVEVVTSWPGLGPLLLDAVMSRDIYVVVGAIMASTLFMVFGNFLADVLLVLVDPRVRTVGAAF